MRRRNKQASNDVGFGARALVAGVALAALCLACADSGSTGTATSPQTEAEQPVVVSGAPVEGAQVAHTEPVAQGMRAFVDPVTGKITTTPDAATLREVADAAELSGQFDTRSEGLVEQTLPDGSVMVDLRGRFRSASVATVDSPEIECQSNLPKSDAKSDRKED